MKAFFDVKEEKRYLYKRMRDNTAIALVNKKKKGETMEMYDEYEDFDPSMFQDEFDADLDQHECPRCKNVCDYCLMLER